MKSFELFREDEWTVDGRKIVGPTKLPEEPIPLSILGEDLVSYVLVGMVTNIRRVDNRVWGDVHMQSGFSYPEAVTTDIDSMEVEKDRDGRIVVASGRLVNAMCNSKSNYPWKDEDEDA